jgi:hypothetical protein
MRLLRLDFRDQRATLDLHPLLTVLTATDAVIQAQIFAAVRRLSRGETVGLRGLIQHEGLLFELNPSVGRPLGTLSTSASILVPVDVVGDQAGAAVLRNEIEHWESQATIDSIAVEELRFQLNLTAVSALADQSSTRADAGAALLERRERQATRVLAVAKVLDVVRREPPHITLPDEARDPLLQRWKAYLASVERHSRHLAGLSEGLARADRDVARAAERVAKAKAEAVPVRLSDEQEARLEELIDRSHERSLVRRGRLSADEQAELDALFAIVGVTSWTGYTMYRADPRPTPEREEKLRSALDDLDRAAADQQRLVAEFQADEIASSMETELAAIREACKPLLGLPMPSDIGVALQSQLNKVENPAWAEVGKQLRDVISSIGLNPPAGLELNELVAWAEAWVADQARSELSASEASGGEGLADDHTAGDPRAETVPADRSPADRSPADRTPAGGRRVASARLSAAFSGLITDDELLRLERAAERHRAALGRIHHAEREAVRSALRLRSLAGCLDRQVTGTSASSAGEVIEPVVNAVTQLAEDVSGSVPVAVVGDLLSLGERDVYTVMDALSELSRRVQLVLLTESYHAVRWAEQAGPQRALATRARPRPPEPMPDYRRRSPREVEAVRTNR